MTRRQAQPYGPDGVTNDKPRPVRVAVIGGGCAGLAAAWELSRPDPEADVTYDITVYEKSWRLGGKGASGRDEYGRILEHGIHIWLGFYENAFRMMRECYEEVGKRKGWGPESTDRDGVLPYTTFDQAFFPEAHVGVGSKGGVAEAWKIWSGLLPPMEGLPGTPLDDETNPFTLQGYLIRAIEMTKALIHSVVDTAEGVGAGKARPDGRSGLDERLDRNFSVDPAESPAAIVDSLVRFLRGGTLTSAAALLQTVTIIESFIRERDVDLPLADTLLSLIETVTTQARKQLRDIVNIDPETRRKTQVIDLVMTIAVGVFRDRVLLAPNGLDAINHIDCKEWLLRHGAVKESVESPFVTGLYDLAFCYRDGDRSQPALSAGQALRGALRMFFSYRGAIFWRMRGGMGETVFSPLFRVLRARGVKFRFLHTLDGVDIASVENEPRITKLRFHAFAQRGTFDDDSPLDHFGCWRHAAPETSGRLDVELRDGDGFDAVVVSTGLDDFVKACGKTLGTSKELPAQQRRRWNDMSLHVRTIATQAAQVWMTESLPKLGWQRGSALISALDGPFETWADMTHTLPAERAWRAHPGAPPAARAAVALDRVQSVAYFCGVLADKVVAECHKSDAALTKLARTHLHSLLTRRMRLLWPKAKSPLKLLATAAGGAGGSLDDQHVQVNFEGSDRYTLAVPGSIEHRISPLERLLANMTIAGDWTECGFNEGCIEAAVMSGMLAAHAISGKPALDDIIGFNHP